MGARSGPPKLRSMNTSAIVQAFAPTGVLRASINLGNPILAGRDAATGEPAGVSVDLARRLAERLGLAVELKVFDKAAQTLEPKARFIKIDVDAEPALAQQFNVRGIPALFLFKDGKVVEHHAGMADLRLLGRWVQSGQKTA